MFMKCFVSIFSTLLIFLVVKGVLAFLRRPREAKDQTVVWSWFKLMLVIGLLGCGLGLLLALWGFLDNGPPGVIALCLGASFLLGGDIILGYFNCRVAYREEDFTVRNFWGVKRTYTYDQIPGPSGCMWEARWSSWRISPWAGSSFCPLPKSNTAKGTTGRPSPSSRPKRTCSMAMWRIQLTKLPVT